jgi:nicotinamidase-related amidase
MAIGAFYATELHQILINAAVSHLIIVGVTTECCVTTTLREANDRGNDFSVILGAVEPDLELAKVLNAFSSVTQLMDTSLSSSMLLLRWLPFLKQVWLFN